MFGAAIVAFVIVTVLGLGSASAEILSPEELRIEMNTNKALRSHIRDRGYPDLAQRWSIDDARWPWESYIVRLFYLGPRTEIAFSRAFVLETRRLGMMRYRRSMSDEMAAEVRRYLASAPKLTDEDLLGDPGQSKGDPADRAEAAARRAEVAADMTELGAVAAEQAAKRLESVAAEAEASFQKQLQK
jgi:hypothetical protein